MRNIARISVVLALLPLAVFAGDIDDGAAPDKRPEMTREERRAAWDKLSEEEKRARKELIRARREEARKRWESMTPDERAAKKAEMRNRMESMTPEQRERMRQRRDKRGRPGGSKDSGA